MNNESATPFQYQFQERFLRSCESSIDLPLLLNAIYSIAQADSADKFRSFSLRLCRLVFITSQALSPLNRPSRISRTNHSFGPFSLRGFLRSIHPPFEAVLARFHRYPPSETRHSYVSRMDDDLAVLRARTTQRFHVSPFHPLGYKHTNGRKNKYLDFTFHFISLEREKCLRKVKNHPKVKILVLSLYT